LLVEIFRLSRGKVGLEIGFKHDKEGVFQHFHPVLLSLEFSLRMQYFKRKSSKDVIAPGAEDLATSNLKIRRIPLKRPQTSQDLVVNIPLDAQFRFIYI
jgi:hypothetical protein